MSFSEADVEFFAWLDEQEQAPEGLLVTTREGETRCVPFPSLAEFRTRRRARFPRLERAQHQLAIFAHMLEKEERQ